MPGVDTMPNVFRTIETRFNISASDMSRFRNHLFASLGDIPIDLFFSEEAYLAFCFYAFRKMYDENHNPQPDP